MYKDYLDLRKQKLLDFFKKDIRWINSNIKYDNLRSFKGAKKHLKHLDSKKHLPNEIQRELISLSDIPYIPNIDIKRAYQNVLFPMGTITDKNLVKYVIFEEGDVMTVIFRGTKTWTEVLSNIKFYRVPFQGLDEKDEKKFFMWRDKFLKHSLLNKKRVPLKKNHNIEIHKGFQDEAFPIIFDLFNHINSNVKNINLIGHSLGGVIGTISAIMLKKNFPKINVNLVTVASPPVGSKNFNLLMVYYGVNSVTRLFNYQDFIPHYGYYGSWIESKKFRHLDFMLNEGFIPEREEKLNNKIFQLNKTKLRIYDLGENLEKWLKDNSEEMNMKYIVHDVFKVGKEKAIFI